MKDQYFGDVNDYRKYGLLRILCKSTGLPIGVCWMLTESDTSNDGEKRGYLESSGKWRHFDPELFDKLRAIEIADGRRSVKAFEGSDLLNEAKYQSSLLVDSALERRQYFEVCDAQFEQCDLVFFDPDNGVEVKSVPYGAKSSCKYVYWSELESVFAKGKSIVVYQHFPRIKRDDFIASLVSETTRRLPGCRIDTYSTAHVLFLVAAQQEHVSLHCDAPSCVRERWQEQISHRNHATES
ncbi:MAG TPA: hypothetical protein VNI20_08665 [Fimbriimonadaceae bacterium]|nr:hypothetical protein [Fimbriimonadaceae bacterium]